MDTNRTLALGNGFIDNEPATWFTDLAKRDFPAVTEYAERVQAEVNVYCRK